MKKIILVLFTACLAFNQASAWNDKGHMVVARLAWKELSQEERTKIHNILKVHPHYMEFLSSHVPNGYTVEEWVFVRAATWSDWVKSGPPQRTKYANRPAHYFDRPLKQDPTLAVPPAIEPVNVVSELKKCMLQIKNGGSQEDKAVALTNLFHFTGDIAQPLHCISLYNNDYLHGDRGGNMSHVRVDGKEIQLHSFMDRIMGTSTSYSSINKTALEIGELVKNQQVKFDKDINDHKTPDEWANEGFDLAVDVVYLDGKLKPFNAQDDHHGVAPSMPSDYAEDCSQMALYCAGKGGKRLANYLKEIAALN